MGKEERVEICSSLFTCDEGWASLANIVPWIVEKNTFGINVFFKKRK